LSEPHPAVKASAAIREAISQAKLTTPKIDDGNIRADPKLMSGVADQLASRPDSADGRKFVEGMLATRKQLAALYIPYLQIRKVE
jgi:hypothetical protein